MEELTEPKNFDENLNFKMSNMNMNIKIQYLKTNQKLESSYWIDKEKLNNYLLSKGIETKYIYYQDCAKIFAKKQSNNVSKNSKFFSDKILGLPTHSKITRNYMDHIGTSIKNFYERKR